MSGPAERYEAKGNLPLDLTYKSGFTTDVYIIVRRNLNLLLISVQLLCNKHHE